MRRSLPPIRERMHVCSPRRWQKRSGKNISRLKGYEPVQGYVERIMKEGLHYNIANTQYTDDSKITDHYAIIPTGQLTERVL